jgi:hypothetical protein
VHTTEELKKMGLVGLYKREQPWVEVEIPAGDPDAGLYRVRVYPRPEAVFVEVEKHDGEKWVALLGEEHAGVRAKIYVEARDSGLL